MHFAELTKPSEGPFVFVMCVTRIAARHSRGIGWRVKSTPTTG